MEDRRLSDDRIAEHRGVFKDMGDTRVTGKEMPGHDVGRLWKCERDEVDGRGKSEGANGQTDAQDHEGQDES